MRRYLLLVVVMLCCLRIAYSDVETRLSDLEQWKAEMESKNLDNRLTLIEQWKATIDTTIDSIMSWLGFSGTDVCERIGNCQALSISCQDDSYCTTGWIGEPFCDADVYQLYLEEACINPGTLASECVGEATPTLKETCSCGCSNAECLPCVTEKVIFRTSVLNDQWMLITRDNNSWIAMDLIEGGDLEAACYVSKYPWRYCTESYRTTYPVVAQTPEGYDVISKDMIRFYVCDKSTGLRIYFTTEVSPINPELSTMPTEPYTSNNQEVLGFV